MNEKVELIFEEPPVSARMGRPSKYTDWLTKLRQHPNVWAKWPTEVVNPSSVASNIRRGKAAGVSEGEYDAVGRRPVAGRNKGYLYVRYVGGSK